MKEDTLPIEIRYSDRTGRHLINDICVDKNLKKVSLQSIYYLFINPILVM